ncbi:MAG: DUF721 domain-containing protein [Phycisphaerales bacterium]|nr:DUF721 domain-containing protein [Phycisphaerales bacterium]
MGIEQDRFQRELERRRRRGPLTLGESPPPRRDRPAAPAPVARVLARLLRQARAGVAASEAWSRVARPGWRRNVRVERYEGGMLDLVASDAAVRHEVLRERVDLLRRLSAFLPGVHGLRVLTGDLRAGLDGEEGT